MFSKRYKFKFFFSLLIISTVAACNVTDSDDEDDENGLSSDDPEIRSDYQFNLTVSAGDHVVELTFGQIEGATNSFDPGLDLEAPPAPPENVIHAWFENDGRNLFKDYRDQESQELIWPLMIDPAGFELILLEWSREISDLPGNVVITNTAGSVSVDMMNENFTEITVEHLDGLQIEFLVDPDAVDDPDGYVVDETTAIQIAENLLFPDEMGTEARTLTADDFTNQKSVDEIFPIDDRNGINALYVINYEEGGFVVLSADRRVEPVLAYSVDNMIDVNADIFNPGMVDWFIYTTAYIEDERDQGGSPHRLMSMLWDTVIELPVDIYYLSFQDICPADGLVHMVGPHLETQWGQGCGYNDNVDYSCPDDSHRCYRAPTGCVATAMAQIARFWSVDYENENGTPVIHFWDDMPNQLNNEGESSDVAILMSNMGGLVDMNYGCDGSTASSGDAYDEFVDNFGLSNAQERDLDSNSDYQAMFSNIEDGYPVYLRGCRIKETSWKLFTSYEGCHAWIADGTSERRLCTGEILEDTFKIHMNWGWNGNSDGEYRIKGKEGDFEYDRSMIYNIF